MNSENEVKTEVTNTEPTIISPVSESTEAIPTVSPIPEEPTVVEPVENEATETLPIVNEPVAMEPVESETLETTPDVSEPVAVEPETVVQETTEPIGDASGDTGAMVNENLKKVEINYTPPSKFKTTMLILFFIFLIAFVIFLPEITTFVNKYKSGAYNYKEEKITDGKLKCSLSTSTTNLDKNYDLVFRFTDNKLEKTEFSITTRGDSSLDEKVLDELANTCKELAAEDLEGVTIRCDYKTGKLVETQVYDLAKVDLEALEAAFIEAGGNNPEYQAGQDMDQIERNMNASGYTCKREK